MDPLDIFPNATNSRGGAMTTPSTAATPLVLTIEDAAQRLGIGRTLMYALVMSNEVESVTIGRLRRIPAECIDEYVERLRASSRRHEPPA
jgi:excisionase family DNA binding protein